VKTSYTNQNTQRPKISPQKFERLSVGSETRVNAMCMKVQGIGMMQARGVGRGFRKGRWGWVEKI